MSARRSLPPEVSVVVPVVDGHGDLRGLCAGFSAELARLGRSCEFIFVVAEPQRALERSLRGLAAAAGGGVSIVGVAGSSGESGALAVGLQKARGRVVMTLAPYLQVEPRVLEPAFAALAETDLVVGRREPLRQGLASRLFHWLLSRATGVRLRDVDCGFRLMHAHVARAFNLYGHQHRFLAVLARHHGFLLREIAAPAGAEAAAGDTGSLWGRFLDLLTVFFLVRFTRRPLRFFGPLGAGLLALGTGIDLVVALQKLVFGEGIADRPALLLGTLLIVLGVQVFSLGLVGEIIIFTHSRELRDHRVFDLYAGDEPEPASTSETRARRTAG